MVSYEQVCYEQVCYEGGLFRVVCYKQVCFERKPFLPCNLKVKLTNVERSAIFSTDILQTVGLCRRFCFAQNDIFSFKLTIFVKASKHLWTEINTPCEHQKDSRISCGRRRENYQQYLVVLGRLINERLI